MGRFWLPGSGEKTAPASSGKIHRKVSPTGKERFFHENEIIVTKTDLKGHITYANPTFLKLAGMTEDEALGAPHSVIRHPDMPRAVFKLLWDQIQLGKEVFAYVNNMATNGDHYWVFAHVTPTFDDSGKIIGYHSNRRVPDRPAVETMNGLYAKLLEIERSERSRADGLEKSFNALVDLLRTQGVTYDAFIFSLQG